MGWVEVGTGGALGRFVLGGAVNTCLTDVLFLVLSSILPYPVAYTIVYACGIAIAYALATSFVFRTNFALRTALRFPIVSVARYFYGLVALWLLIDGLNVPHEAAILIVLVTGIPLTFLVSRQVIAPGGRSPRI